MQELLDWLEYIEDDRQQRKIRHTLKDILVIVLFTIYLLMRFSCSSKHSNPIQVPYPDLVLHMMSLPALQIL